MNGVAEGVEDAGYLAVDVGVMRPDVAHRHGDVLCKAARPVNAHSARGGAEVPPPRQTVSTTTADDVALSTYHLAGEEVNNVRADGRHFPLELVPYYHGHGNGSARPRVPLQDMQVRSADGRPVHPDEHIVDADLRNRYFLEPQPRLRPALHQRLHLLRHGFVQSLVPRQWPEPAL